MENAHELDQEACYRAVLTRDARFDGRFFGCVKTTGIYCRPVCPARTPKRENMVFVVSAAAGLFIATAAFGIIMALQARELARERDAARFQAARAEASSEFMSLMFETVGPSGRPMTMVELLDAGTDLLDRQYQGDPRFQGRMLVQMSRRYMDVQNTSRQREVLARAETIARTEEGVQRVVNNLQVTSK